MTLVNITGKGTIWIKTLDSLKIVPYISNTFKQGVVKMEEGMTSFDINDDNPNDMDYLTWDNDYSPEFAESDEEDEEEYTVEDGEEYDDMYGGYEDDSHLAMYDDDPSPYDGTYSEM